MSGGAGEGGVEAKERKRKRGRKKETKNHTSICNYKK